MDDSCAVCADALEWVAYGPCGHRDVCSTCVARLRFICQDRRCCICKSENSIVFVTKALGDYTRMISDFSVLPTESREGRVGSYWYHEDTEAFFDDVDHYKMIKAMCRLSCSVCDNMEGPNERSKRRPRFRSIEQLKGHLFHQHKLLMCSLCLEGRKVFICEQKLYTRAQLNQHINTGDSEVDGTESERGGFMGHPICAFCRTPFYGDNELYTHMSTEHYTCHMCQRQHPGQYEYYKNYDDLEIHFRRDHFLCEDEACLTKKFVVFQSETEMKRHNAIEHGGCMSRAERNAALQIPICFRYRRNNEQVHHRGRGRTFHREPSDDNQLSIAIQASLETVGAESTSYDPSSSRALDTVHSDGEDIDPLIRPFESLATTESELASRYLQALGQNSRTAALEESSFPPLPLGSSSGQQISRSNSEGLSNNSMAAHLRRKSNRNATVLHSGGWPSTSHRPVLPSVYSTQPRPATNVASVVSQSSGSGPSTYAASAQVQSQAWSTAVSSASSRNGGNTSRSTHSASAPNPENGSLEPSDSDFPPVSAMKGHKLPSSSQPLPMVENVQAANRSSYADSAQAQVQPWSTAVSSASSRNSSDTARIIHSASAPTPANGLLGPSDSDFPPVSAVKAHKLPSSSQTVPNVENVQAANRSLVEKMRAALEYDEDKYAAFKDLSAQYRQGLIETRRYLENVQKYGLSHLVLELARLCPDPQKQKELIETYNASLKENNQLENDRAYVDVQVKDANGSKKGKGKSVSTEGSKNVKEKSGAADASNSKDALAHSILSTVRELQSSFKSSEENMDVLSKDGYRDAKGKPNVMAYEQLRGQNDSSTASVESSQTSVDGGDGGKQRKKTSKFLRARLGDGSMSALLDNKISDSSPDPESLDNRLDGNQNLAEGVSLPVRGVWKRGGGHKLFS